MPQLTSDFGNLSQTVIYVLVKGDYKWYSRKFILKLDPLPGSIMLESDVRRDSDVDSFILISLKVEILFNTRGHTGCDQVIDCHFLMFCSCFNIFEKDV